MAYRARRRATDPEYAAREAAHGIAYRRENGRAAQDRYRERNREALRQSGRERARELRQDPDFRARANEASKRHWASLKAEMISAYGGACSCCGESESAFLSLEHLNGDGAEHRASLGGASKVWADLKKRGWPKDGYTVLCFNCNLGKRCNGGICPHQMSVSALISLYAETTPVGR